MHVKEKLVYILFSATFFNSLFITKQRTSLFFDGVDQVDVILCHQCDGHTIPPCRGRKPSCMCCIYFRCVMTKSKSLMGNTWMMLLLKKREKATCSRCPSDSVDVDLGETGGVVVDDDLDRWNIQAPCERTGKRSKHGDVSRLW